MSDARAINDLARRVKNQTELLLKAPEGDRMRSFVLLVPVFVIVVAVTAAPAATTASAAASTAAAVASFCPQFGFLFRDCATFFPRTSYQKFLT